MKKHIILHIAAILLIIAVTAAFFFLKSGTFDKEPKVAIIAENCYDSTITVMMGYNYAPFSFVKDGEYSGHDVELANELANRLHMNVRLEFDNWSTCLEKIRSSEADLVMTADYEMPIDGIDYSIPTASIPWFAFTGEENETIRSYGDLYGKRIGVVEETDPLRNPALAENYVVFRFFDEAFHALEEGRVDTVIAPYSVGTFIAANEGHGSIHADYEIAGAHLAIGVRANRKELLNKVNQIVSDMSRDGTLEQLNNKWCGSFVKKLSLADMWESEPEYFVVAGFALTLLLALLALLLFKVNEQRKEAKLKEKIEFQNQLITQLIKEYSDIYFIRSYEDKNADTCELLFKGGITDEDVMLPGEGRPFKKELDYFIDNVVLPEDRERVTKETRRERIEENTAGGGVSAVDFRVSRGGELHHYQMRFVRVSDMPEMNSFVVGIRLVDKEVRLLEQLASEKANAEAANIAKTSFLFNMSHDIRTPLNAIMGFTDMAKKNTDDKEKLLTCLDNTQQAGVLLLSLINSVLEMSRIEAGKAELDLSPAKVDFSFEGIKSTMMELAKKKDIALSLEMGDIADHYVYADLSRANRIFINIISNSIKYTGIGGRIKARCEQIGRVDDETGLYRYTFEDNGMGMSEEFQKNLFDAFAREKNSTVSGIQGSGLGLTVARSFVELMNGTIKCESRLGEGTTFTVTLPFKLQKEDEAAKFMEPASGKVQVSSSEDEENSTHDFAGKRILVVEDNEMNREIVSFILSEKEFCVEEADDGTTAVQMLREKGPDYYDAILMDIQMPMMNGHEATKAIREMYPDAELPIIAVSANAFAEDKVTSIEAGMNDHIAKPIDTDELLGVLGELIGRHE